MYVMVNKKMLFEWAENHPGLTSLLSLLCNVITIIIAILLSLGAIGKMLLLTFLIATLILTFSYITIKYAIIYVRSPLKTEIEQLSSELESETKQYDELVKQVKLSRSIKESVTIEEGGPPVVTTSYGVPRIIFDMRVINRTFFTFEPEKATIECFCNGETEPITVTCNKKGGKRGVERTHIRARKLLKYEDEKISCHIPIDKLYDDLSEWKLIGTIEYKVKGNMLKPEDLQLNPPVELKIDVKYVLPEDEQKKLKEEVKKALGDKR